MLPKCGIKIWDYQDKEFRLDLMIIRKLLTVNDLGRMDKRYTMLYKMLVLSLAKLLSLKCGKR